MGIVPPLYGQSPQTQDAALPAEQLFPVMGLYRKAFDQGLGDSQGHGGNSATGSEKDNSTICTLTAP